LSASTVKLERQLNLMAALLQTRRPMTADEIRKRVPGYPAGEVAFRRAFERDKDELRAMGIPVVLEDIPETNPPIEGYRIPRDQYYLRDPGLDADELAALQLAASAVPLEGVEGSGALWKLGGVVAEPGGVDADGDELAALPSHPALVPLFAAVAERRPATFTYNGVQRTVDPYRLDFQRGRWYLTAYDHLRGDERNYRLERIEGNVETGRPKSFRRPSTHVPGVPLHPWQLGEGETVTARVLVDRDQAPAAVAYAGADAVVEERTDGVVLEVDVTNRAGFRTFVLGFLDHAEVLDPPELRREIVSWLATMEAGAE
jgi:predicted DNA-binding transcriptional regulator YafY